MFDELKDNLELGVNEIISDIMLEDDFELFLDKLKSLPQDVAKMRTEVTEEFLDLKDVELKVLMKALSKILAERNDDA